MQPWGLDVFCIVEPAVAATQLLNFSTLVFVFDGLKSGISIFRRPLLCKGRLYKSRCLSVRLCTSLSFWTDKYLSKLQQMDLD